MQKRLESGVRAERTGWRCEAISSRHREWGYDCPAVDLDFMMAEYNYGLPVALIEYKDKHARNPDLSSPTIKALSALADGYRDGALPFMVVFYCPEEWWFKVTPVNAAAKALYGHVADQPITEQRFVTSLYRLRKKVLTERDTLAISKLSVALPEMEAA